MFAEATAQIPRDLALSCTCLHCGGPLSAGQARFCCLGCRAVFSLLTERGLGQYYDLTGRNARPAPAAIGRRDHKWLEVLAARPVGDMVAYELDIQGIHCGACVWLIERLFREQGGGAGIAVNPTLGRIELTVASSFGLEAWVTDVEQFGYLLGPAHKDGAVRSDDLLVRLGACAALSLNAMMFAAAQYVGLAGGRLSMLLRDLTYAASFVAVLVGGSVFIRAAWFGAKRRLFNLDLPIATGIILAFLGSSWGYWKGLEGAQFSDTVCVFITLMLLGRFVQERLLERNRRALLNDDSADGLLVRRRGPAGPELARAGQLSAGDELLLAYGDLCPVRARAQTAVAVRLDWINGESTEQKVEAGHELAAGAFVMATEPVVAVALEGMATSALRALLRSPVRDELSESSATAPMYSWFSPVYVAVVFVLATVAASYWGWARGSWLTALEVTTAVLVVTCPCAIGLATPLAYEIVLRGLRQRGLFVRTRDLLDKLRAVKVIALDKTGTLTTGTLDAASGEGLAEPDAAIFRAMTSLSSHPKSRAVRKLLGAGPERELSVTEVSGKGLEAHVDGIVYRVGQPSWAAAEDKVVDADVVLSRDNATLVSLVTREDLRDGAKADIGALIDLGYDVRILSGDSQVRVNRVARALGLDSQHAHGAMSPADKEAAVLAMGPTVLMIGDGVNDAPAAARSFCSGTPAIDRPFLPARTDFYFTSASFAPVRTALRMSHALRRALRINLAFALTYNALALGLAFAHKMTPLLAAILMPVSSVIVVVMTAGMLSERTKAWKS